MNQRGTVLQIKGTRALVAVSRPLTCGHSCATCSSHCHAPTHKAWAVNKKQAKPGDVVLLSSDGKAVLAAAFFVYFVPLLLFFAGYIISDFLLKHTPISIIISLFMMVLSFILLRIFDKRIAPTIHITEILLTDTEKRNSSHGI